MDDILNLFMTSKEGEGTFTYNDLSDIQLIRILA